MYTFVRGLAVASAFCCVTSAVAAPKATFDNTTPAPKLPLAAAVTSYAAIGGEVESLLLREDHGSNDRRLTGVTRLGNGTRLWEEARFDAAGKLVHAESMCSSASGSSETIVFDANTGVVEVRNARGSRRGSVPTDHPWFWVARDCGGAEARTLATPVSALVAMRAATPNGVRRLVDPRTLASHTITADQVLVPEGPDAVWVVLGDDAVLIRAGLPQRWRANALGVDIARR